MENYPAEHDEIVAQFCAMTGVSTTQVRILLWKASQMEIISKLTFALL